MIAGGVGYGGQFLFKVGDGSGVSWGASGAAAE